LIFKKTQGNPLFVNQLLHILHKNKHINFVKPSLTESSEIGGWVCDTKAIMEANYTSNVVDMMISSLRKLHASVQQLLGAAAIIGNYFEVVHVSLLCPQHDIPTELHTIVKYVKIILCMMPELTQYLEKD
jgi:predicted ATPase